jgi:hypothetical protein
VHKTWRFRVMSLPPRLSQQLYNFQWHSALLWRFNVAGNNKMYLGLHVIRLMFLPDFNQIWISLTDCIEDPSINYTKIHAVGVALVHVKRRTDGRTDGKID